MIARLQALNERHAAEASQAVPVVALDVADETDVLPLEERGNGDDRRQGVSDKDAVSIVWDGELATEAP